MKGKKGFLQLPIMVALSVLMFFIAMQLFLPIGDLLGTSIENMPNSGIVMTLTWLIPVVLVGLMIYGYVEMAQGRRQQ